MDYNEAKNALESGISAARVYARQYVDEIIDRYFSEHYGQFGTDAPQYTDEQRASFARKALADLAYTNRSQWSGGPATATNVMEYAIREAAIEALTRDFRLDVNYSAFRKAAA